MKVLKFEGNLFSNKEGYKKAVEIITNQVKKDTLAIIIPSNHTTEESLISIAALAVQKNATYLDLLSSLETEYLDFARALIPVQEQSSALSFLKQRFNEIDNLYKGISLLGESPESAIESIRCYGSILSSYLLAACIKSEGVQSTWVDAREHLVFDNSQKIKLLNSPATSKNLGTIKFENGLEAIILPGAIAKSLTDSNVHLGIGGADISSSVISTLLDASVLEIWTLSTGMMTADPVLVNNARIIKQINYEEAMELSHFEATIFYPPAMELILKKGLPIHIKSIASPELDGTTISNEEVHSDEIIKGISNLTNISLVNVEGSGMIGVPGFSKKMFSSLNDAGINIILITQGASEHSICVGVKHNNSALALKTLSDTFKDEISTGIIKPILVEEDLCILGLVGDKMKSHPGISGRMFSALGRNGINIRAIAQGSNERNISTVIKTAESRKALNVLHEAFFENTKKELNLFIIGTGNVGKKLIRQISLQADKIEAIQRLKINIIGLCNSRKMIISEKGISSTEWESILEKADKANPTAFVQSMTSMNLRNSVMIDMTANASIPELYELALKKSMSVVACNKIAASSKYDVYKSLKEMAVSYNCKFLFETNVGAALPIIGTLNDLTRSGDKIIKIDAVLSGTLNFVFNNYDTSRTFAKVVKQAQDEGYTEPDPRLDLSGMDVMRKIMILVRESGIKLEMDDIACNSFLPESCMNGSVDDFYKELEVHEKHFASLYEAANKNNAKLKFVASYKDGKASVGLQHIQGESEMYHLYGKDNIVLFSTERYSDQPLVVKGAGAGAEVTASGVFADILRSINN